MRKGSLKNINESARRRSPPCHGTRSAVARSFWYEVSGFEFLLPGGPAAAPAAALGTVPATTAAAAPLVAATAAPAAVVVFRREFFARSGGSLLSSVQTLACRRIIGRTYLQLKQRSWKVLNSEFPSQEQYPRRVVKMQTFPQAQFPPTSAPTHSPNKVVKMQKFTQEHSTQFSPNFGPNALPQRRPKFSLGNYGAIFGAARLSFWKCHAKFRALAFWRILCGRCFLLPQLLPQLGF